ncbi:glycoside hydrolase family 95 protein [Xylogone sp. PMI_703]|nr:glycoside hydrolase family 95 protein [Xylogone sp. PMI_703]
MPSTPSLNSSSAILRYTSPASEWAEALPIGNGRLGAMVYGRTDTELLQLNENSVWYGGRRERTPPDAAKNLSLLRELIRAEKHKEAEKLVRQAFYATPQSQCHYEHLGNLTIDFDHEINGITNYSRSLSLESAITSVKYEYHGASFRREVFASQPDNVLVIKLESSEKSEFTLRLTRMGMAEFDTNELVDSIVATEDGTIIMRATPGGRGSNHICSIAQVKCHDDGIIEVMGSSLVVTSQKTTIVLSTQTTFRFANEELAALSDARSAIGRDDLKERHVDDYQSLYNRMKLYLHSDGMISDISTDKRLLTTPDPSLVVLYHNLGRYLLIACSRPGFKSLPSTLQGLWNPEFQPVWGSKYTININTEMNYWPANMCNLSECELPLFDMLERMAVRGKRTAEVMYKCRGWCAHHNTDIWADTDPQDRCISSTLWPLGGAWLCYHIWEHYNYTDDKQFLKRMFPVLKSCVQFLVDFLIEDASGKYLVTNPSLSPENTYIGKTGATGVLCEGATIDTQIIHALFTAYIGSLSELNIRDDDLVSEVIQSRERLPPMKIGSLGQLQEWAYDYEEYEPGHRHTSHLWGLHPGNQITNSLTPDLAAAATVTLRRRAEHGGGHTGWSRAWLINLHARLGDAEGCLEHIHRLLKDSTMPNMLDTHPPFQIDGNFGGSAGIIEMLIQSHEGVINLLPACPGSWQSGSLIGVLVRGGFEVDFEWERGIVKEPIVLRSKSGKTGVVRFPGGSDVKFQGKGTHEIYSY